MATSDQEEMDIQAAEAEGDIPSFVEQYGQESLKPAANWLKKWYLKAGYKRLCRILLQYADDETTANSYTKAE